MINSALEEKKTDWKVVIIVFGAGVVASAHIGKLPPALPEIRNEFDAGLVMGGWFVSMISAVGFGLGLVAGGVADRIGQRLGLMIGLIALAAGSALGTISETSFLMLVSRFIESIGFTASTITGGAIIARISAARDRKWAMGIWAAYMPIGFASMMMVAVYFLHYFDWRYLWIMSSVLSVAWAIITFLAIRKIKQLGRNENTRISSPIVNIVQCLTRPGGVLVAFCFAFYTAQHISMMSWLPTYMREDYGAGLMLAALLPALILIFNAGGNALAAWLMSWKIPIWLLLFVGAGGMGLTEIGIFNLVLSDSVRLVLAFAFGIFGGFIPAAALAAAPVYAPSPALLGTMNGLMVMGSNSGQLFGPPLVAMAQLAAGSWYGVLWLLLCFAGSGMILAYLTRSLETAGEGAENA